jgi:hypothetical protein
MARKSQKASILEALQKAERAQSAVDQISTMTMTMRNSSAWTPKTSSTPSSTRRFRRTGRSDTIAISHRPDINNPTLFNGLYKRSRDTDWQVVREIGWIGTYVTPAFAEAAAKHALFNDAKALEGLEKLKIVGGLVKLFLRRTDSRGVVAAGEESEQPQEWLGAFLLLQFIDGHHWEIPAEKFETYTADVPPELQSIMKFWTLIYLACLFRWAVIAKYGVSFATEMMASMHRCFGKHPWGNFNLAKAIDSWTCRIDDVIALAVSQSPITGEEVYPHPYYAAHSFLIFDPTSPYHMMSDVDPHAFDEVAFALARIEDDMKPLIQYFTESFEA